MSFEFSGREPFQQEFLKKMQIAEFRKKTYPFFNFQFDICNLQ
jgi:hypothetical protein